MPAIGFTRLTPAETARVAHLTMAPGQDRFTADPVRRLQDLPPGQDAWGVLDAAGAVVGFLVIDRDYPAAHPFAQAGEHGLRSVLIDAARQGTGLGKAAMAGLRGLMTRHYPGVPGLVLTVNAANPAARAVYLKAGFTDTGEVWLGGRAGPQHVLRMELGAP